MADGDLVAAMNIARQQLRDCYWWRRLADPNNAWDDATALSHIYFDELPPPADGAADHSANELISLRPFCIMWADISGGFRWRSDSGDFCCSLVSGVVVMQIEINVPSELRNDPTALAIDTNRKLGRIIRTGDLNEPGLLDLRGMLPITEAKISGYIRTDSKAANDIGDAITAEIELRWGVTE